MAENKGTRPRAPDHRGPYQEAATGTWTYPEGGGRGLGHDPVFGHALGKGCFQPNRPATIRRVIAFLGYDPLPHSENIPDRLRLKRRQLGWRQVDLAAHLGVQECTVRSWEAGGTILMRAHRASVAVFLGLPEDDLIRHMGDRLYASHGRRPVGRA